MRRHILRVANFLLLAVLSAAVGVPGATPRDEPRRIRATDLYRIRTASDVAVSPDARRVAYVVTVADSADNSYYSHIWIADAEEGDARQYTRGKVRDRSPVWSPDGSRIAFVSGRGDAEAGQIYVLPVDGGEAWQLTDRETGAANPVWTPDGRGLLFTSSLTTDQLDGDHGGVAEAAAASANGDTADADAAGDTAMWGSLSAIRNWLGRNARKEEPAVISRLDFLGEHELTPIEQWSHIFAIDLDGGEPRRLTDGPYDFRAPAIAPDGRRIAFAAVISDSVHPDYIDVAGLYVMDADGTDRRRIEVPGHSVFSVAWSPDGRRLAFAARDSAELTATHTQLAVIDADGGGAGDIRWVSRSLDRSVRTYRWSPDGRALYFNAGVHGTVPIYRAAPGDAEIRQIVSGERGALQFDLRKDRLAFVITEPANPSEVYSADADGDDERRLTTLNSDWLEGVRVQPHRSFWYRSFDGRRVQGWLIEPVGRTSDRRYPLALEIHGGPHAMWGPGERTMWHEFQFLAANGYYVVYTNPRGSDGYGLDFKLAIQRAWGDGPMRDVLTAVDTVVAREVVDPDRMVVTGGSYAGYLTAL